MIDFTRLAKLRDELNKAVDLGDAKKLRSILTSCYVNLNFVDKQGQTPLHRSCSSGSIDTCRILVEYGASQSIRNSAGWYPIHLASYYGHTDIVKFLLDETNFKKESLINVQQDGEDRHRSCSKNLFPTYRQRAESNEESSDEEQSDDEDDQDYEDLVYGLEIESNADHLVHALNGTNYSELINIQNLELNSDDFLF